MRIFCDFDGTIAKVDTTDLVLTRLADPAWEDLEARWTRGEITAAACMRGQIALIGGDEAALDAVLDSVELADGFAEFVAWCQANAVPLTVVSDGVDRFIARILGRHGLDHLPVVANRLAGAALARSLEQPWSRAGCAAGSGVCKCQVAAAEAPSDDFMVFIGDGRSDFCVSGRADLLFARDKLAAYARSRAMPHHEFSDFHTITTTLAAAHGRLIRRAAI
ncbi:MULTISPECIES: MtnX-like HAD-IB family phosphatase [Caulobacter]|jgi:2,3-diketo-5-methylthio-1-phosphopentane phosphatase|uniref:MtnX-like HAD-IB family phosphatase n=1 Tax=Caulobacter TaxID=75 RepID=UPI0006FB4917|nr:MULTISPECIES: MtnX-like HAD-IB family phosphatase [Caulobacter]KQZ28370.1 haloacid dehalogenase [Caulobacter sp. Root1472]GGL10451.1 2,3-diketo-5-methylthio-1-phosphopentane phosphatase [Caulobacter rhizosphaerae]